MSARTRAMPACHCWRSLVILLSAVSALCAARAAAVEYGPQGVVRQFCEADGLGQRVTVQGWPTIAPLVEWPLEPAWDRIVLITSYAVDSPRADERNRMTVTVHYSVAGQLSALGFDGTAYVETVALEARADAAGWRIVGPPPAPHVFGNRVDVDAMQVSLVDGGINFVANSTFVWRMLRSAGWNVDFERTGDLLTGPAYRQVEKPTVGDVVAYLKDGAPYHAGLLEAGGQVVSSTLNAGIVRTSVDGFAGDVVYLRLVQPEPASTSAPAATPTPGDAKSGATPAKTVHRRAEPTPRGKTRQAAKRKKGRTAKPSKGKRVKKKATKRSTTHARPTPRATPVPSPPRGGRGGKESK